MPRPRDVRVRRIMDLITRNLQEARRQSGLSQDEAAKRADIKVGLVSRWEQGRAWIDPGHLKLLADVYGCTVDELYSERPTWVGGRATAPHPSTARQP